MRLFILGTGLLAEELSALAEDMGVHVEAFVENLDRQKDGTALCGRPIIWVDQLPTNAPCVCALSTTKRKTYIEQVQDRAQFVNLVHPSSTILPRTTLGVTHPTAYCPRTRSTPSDGLILRWTLAGSRRS